MEMNEAEKLTTENEKIDISRVKCNQLSTTIIN